MNLLSTKLDQVSEHNSLLIMEHLLSLPSCTMITTGRTGTDFLQSLLDSHPEVLLFNGHFHFYEFWDKSPCTQVADINVSDLTDEFIGKFIERFKSRYDIQERKNSLGESGKECIDIDTSEFKQKMMAMLKGYEITSRNFLLAVYGAYALCLGQDLAKKKLFFHHIHHAERLDEYFCDFPDSKVICMTRDPRANFVSGIEHWRNFDRLYDCEDHLFYYIDRILKDADVLKRYDNQYIVIRLEDLGRRETLDQLVKWLGISYHECLQRSTWGGFLWKGDRLSVQDKKEKGFDPQMLQNSWEERLSVIDKYIFNFLMHERLKHYQYSYKRIHFIDYIMIPILSVLPLRYEWRYFSAAYLSGLYEHREYKQMVRNVWGYLKRIFLFWRYYIRTVKRVPFQHPYIGKTR